MLILNFIIINAKITKEIHFAQNNQKNKIQHSPKNQNQKSKSNNV